MQNNIGLLSNDSKADAPSFGVTFIRNRVVWDKPSNNGVKYMTEGFDYITNIVSNSDYVPTDLVVYEHDLHIVIDSMPVKPKLIVCENEVYVLNKSVSAVVAALKVMVKVAASYGIPVATSGTVMQVANKLTYDNLIANGLTNEAHNFRQRNACSNDAKAAIARTEIELIKDNGLDVYYNWHWQFIDSSYLPDFTSVNNNLIEITGLKQANNEIASRKTDTATATACGEGCKLFGFSAFYNQIGKQGKAKVLPPDSVSAFAAAIK